MMTSTPVISVSDIGVKSFLGTPPKSNFQQACTSRTSFHLPNAPLPSCFRFAGCSSSPMFPFARDRISEPQHQGIQVAEFHDIRFD